MGVEDIKNRIIRTPFNAVESFREDAMRLMRSIRFAYRFDFKLHDSIGEAAKDEEVRLKLKENIHRNRLGIDFEKTLSGPVP
eukprot:CAMPEP_0176341900 /NCGR_PEP_ID=MMETSP0126-20121128/2740_1 /TAXON_ID=141414 ORGANISM="Strombidinopsis acuminatum, Strain SPMC142" /NCGR_SAMPLE_ID=MMETSP0126 /ASSEMBLY_ACC=CAM_ASM_000229 /LENGTH=81 /DNA_ID=CAMNT_0017686979 /DNA_START=495 /DNA_END=740 /DNA_ORIENTATION=-